MQLFQAIKNLLRYAVVTGPSDNDAAYPVQQISYQGKAADMLMLFPYGTHANVPNGALATLFAMEGDAGNKAGFAYTPKDRPVDLEPGEVAFYHPATKTFIKLRNSGNLEIDTNVEDSGGNLVINSAAATVNTTGDTTVTAGGAVNLTATGNVEVEAAQVNVDASVVNLGDGGQAIARVGDSVQVEVTSGSSTGTYSGTITSGGTNTSI